MAQQLCKCADLDWSQVPRSQPEHHPDCTVVERDPFPLDPGETMIRSPEHLRAKMEQRVGAVGPSGLCAFAVTGEPFVVFAIGGPVDEGASQALVATSVDHALRHFWLDYCRYLDLLTAGDCRGFVLYWREFPNVQQSDGYFSIWARLLISDKPFTGIHYKDGCCGLE
jgi:hypothetical protein